MDLLPIPELYAKLLAQGIWSAAARAAIQSGKQQDDVEQIRGEVRRALEERRQHLLQLASVEAIRPELGGDRLRAFLLSAEAREITAGLALARLSSSGTRLVDLLRERFLATLCWYVDRPAEAVRSMQSDCSP